MRRLGILGVITVCAGCAGAGYRAEGVPEVELTPTAAEAGLSISREGDELVVQSVRRTGDTASAEVYAMVEAPLGRAARPPEPAADRDAVFEVPSAPRQPQYAQLAPTSGSATPQAAAADMRATPSSMLIYTAALIVAVLDVTHQQTRLIERAREMGGFLAEQSTEVLRIRIPAARFDEFLVAVSDVGQVLDRRVTVTDVGEEFRDVAIRIQNLEAVRQRFEQMLTQANSVETALAIQRELERVTTALEVLKGRQRYLADQVALSTVTVHFRAISTVYPDEHVNLPFAWLRQLGLRNLLTLDRQ